MCMGCGIEGMTKTQMIAMHPERNNSIETDSESYKSPEYASGYFEKTQSNYNSSKINSSNYNSPQTNNY